MYPMCYICCINDCIHQQTSSPKLAELSNMARMLHLVGLWASSAASASGRRIGCCDWARFERTTGLKDYVTASVLCLRFCLSLLPSAVDTSPVALGRSPVSSASIRFGCIPLTAIKLCLFLRFQPSFLLSLSCGFILLHLHLLIINMVVAARMHVAIVGVAEIMPGLGSCRSRRWCLVSGGWRSHECIWAGSGRLLRSATGPKGRLPRHTFHVPRDMPLTSHVPRYMPTMGDSIVWAALKLQQATFAKCSCRGVGVGQDPGMLF